MAILLRYTEYKIIGCGIINEISKTRFTHSNINVDVILTYGCQIILTIKQNSSSYNHSHATTLFLHGYGGSANSEKYMVQQAVNHGVTNKVITTIVDKNGMLRLRKVS